MLRIFLSFSPIAQSLIGLRARLLRFFYWRQTVKILLIGLATTVVWSGWMLGRLSTEYSVKQFYPENHPLLKKDQEIRRTFGLNERSPFLFVVTLGQEQTWLDPNSIKKLEAFSKSVQEDPGVNQLVTLTSIEGARQERKELLIGSVFNRMPASKWKSEVLSNPLLFPLMVTRDFKSTLIAVEPNAKSTAELEKFHGRFRETLQKEFPGSQVLSAGVPVIQTRLSKMIRSELGKFLVLAVVCFCAIFYFLFSHWTAIACAFLTLLSANLFSLSLLAFLEIPLNVVLITLPIVASVTVMSLLIHTLHLWSQKPASMSDGPFQARWEAAVGTMRELGLANFLGAWTTGLGFLALYPSPIPMIREYGWVVAVVVGLISVYSQAVILICLPWVKPRMRSWFDQPAHWALFSIKNIKTIIVSVVAIAIVGGFLARNLNFSSRLFDDLPLGDGVRASTDWIDGTFGGIVPYEVVLNGPSESYWKTPASLRAADRVADHLRKNPNIGSVITVTDFFQSGVPEKKSSIAETFFLFSLAEQNPLGQILTENAQKLRFMIRLKDQPTLQLESTKQWIRTSIERALPNIEVLEGGMANYAHAINQEVSKELVFGFWQSLLVIGIFLMVVFRSVRWALVACLPNFLPPAVLMGTLALYQVPMKPGIALIFSIALGFAFNNTVYFLARLRSLIKDQKTSLLPVKRALLMEGNPCFFESLVMLVGFSIFILSHFTMNRTFGVLMMVSIVAGFLGDLIFLPALLKLCPGLLLTDRNLPPLSGKDEEGEPRVEPNDPMISQQKEESPMSRVAASIVLALTIGLFSSPAKSQTAQDILQKSRLQLDAKDDQAKVEMKIIEKNGEAKSRTVALKTLRSQGFSVLAKIESPADIKGMGFLGHVKNGKESQWIYLPSSGQVRRVVAGQTKGGLLGSEISPEDLNSNAIKSSRVSIAKQDQQFWWIDIVPAKGTSAYSKAVMQISKADHLPILTQYFAGQRLKKTVEFKDYVKIGSTYRAQWIDVKNHLNGRSTQVRLSQMKINRGLSSIDFSQSALKDE